MKVKKGRKRLKAIKLKRVFLPTKCCRCGEEFILEKMWQCKRYGINRTINTCSYCQNCMHSAEDVLNEIDTDESPFGLARVDSFIIGKKNYDRMNSARPKI